MNSKLLKLRRTVPKPSPTSSSILPSSLIPNLYQFARSAQFISLVFLKITIAPENKAVTLPRKQERRVFPRHAAHVPDAFPRRKGLSRPASEESILDGSGSGSGKRGRGKIVGQPRIPPLPIGRAGSKIQGPLSFGAQNIQGLCPFVPTGVTSPPGPSSRRRRQSHCTVPGPVQMQKAVPTDCRHGGPEKPPLREH